MENLGLLIFFFFGEISFVSARALYITIAIFLIFFSFLTS